MSALRIYVVNLRKYTEGELVGDWLDLPADEDTIQDLYARIGLDDEYEECAIHDYETEFEGLEVSEYDSIENLSALVERLEKLDDVEAFEAILEQEEDLESALDIYEDGNYVYYAGVTTYEELGHYIVEEGLFWGNIPNALVEYLDYERIGCSYACDSSGGFSGNGFLEVC